MVPLIVLVVSTLLARGIGALGVGDVATWPASVAVGLAVMFAITASAHWVQPKRDGLIAIVPARIPHPALVVTLSGTLELLGAIGLLAPATRIAAAICLTILLIAMYPANVRAARGVDHPAAPRTSLVLRTVLQIVFIAATLYVAIAS